MKLARVLFILPSVTFIFIGVMHTFVHLTELSTPELEASLRAIGKIGAGAGQVAEMSDLWHGLSLLMGIFSMAVGATNLASLFGRDKDAPPPLGVTVVSIVTLCAVAVFIGGSIRTLPPNEQVVGSLPPTFASLRLYLGLIQLVGGPIGVACFIASIIVGRRSQTALPT